MHCTQMARLAVVIGLVAACRSGDDATPAMSPETTEAVSGVMTIDWASVDAAIGRPGTSQPGEVHRFGFPRNDLRVTVDGVELKPALALGGWVAMKATPGGVVAMGDLVLTEEELTPVITRLQSGGIEQTAIHHHVVRESPSLLYVHIHGHGDPVKLGETIRAALQVTGTPAPSPAASMSPPFDLDTAEVARTLGQVGRVNGGVYQVSVPRAEAIREGNFEIPPSMGLGTAINFQPTGRGRAAITGDFVLTASEVNAVIRTLRAHDIEVTALHSHMLMEEPRLFFMHFWANDDVLKLARGLRAALDQTNSRRTAS
jgi:hypothetical protein